MQPTNIVRYSEGQNYYRRSSGQAAYGGMSLPIDEMTAVGEAMAGVDLTPPRDAMLVTPPPEAMERLQRLHRAAGDLAKEAPEILANPDAARGLEGGFNWSSQHQPEGMLRWRGDGGRIERFGTKCRHPGDRGWRGVRIGGTFGH